MAPSNFASHSPTDFQMLSQQFWQGTSLEQLLVAQTARPFDTLEAPDFWPEEDSIEDFLIFWQQQRRSALAMTSLH
jgi:hypothetical protein